MASLEFFRRPFRELLKSSLEISNGIHPGTPSEDSLGVSPTVTFEISPVVPLRNSPGVHLEIPLKVLPGNFVDVSS